MIEHEGVQYFLSGLGFGKFETIEVFENGD
jgi:hypothetical protein